RFRSRLEARWAVFFKELGIAYAYEHQGFDLAGEWYLPDFWLPRAKAFVEVKPGPRFHNGSSLPSPKTYWAGRMGFGGKNLPHQCYRPFDTDHPLVGDKSRGILTGKYLGDGWIGYTGPYRTGEGCHLGVHGDSDDYTGAEDNAFSRAVWGIRECDV